MWKLILAFIAAGWLVFGVGSVVAEPVTEGAPLADAEKATPVDPVTYILEADSPWVRYRRLRERGVMLSKRWHDLVSVMDMSSKQVTQELEGASLDRALETIGLKHNLRFAVLELPTATVGSYVEPVPVEALLTNVAIEETLRTGKETAWVNTNSGYLVGPVSKLVDRQARLRAEVALQEVTPWPVAVASLQGFLKGPAYQDVGTTFTVSLRPLGAHVYEVTALDPLHQRMELRDSTGEEFSLHGFPPGARNVGGVFDGEGLGVAVERLAEMAGVAIHLSPEVDASIPVTMLIADGPLEAAVRRICLVSGLRWWLDDAGALWIGED